MKVSFLLIRKPNMAKLSNVGMSLLFYLLIHQDEKGKVWGVHYKDVVKATGMCKQSFYNAMQELYKKELIKKPEKIDDGSYYNIFIHDNDFSDKDFDTGYVNLQRKVFHKEKFKKLKSHEKYLVLYFMMRTYENTIRFKIKPKNLYKNLMELFGVTKRVVRSYIHSIRKYFSVGIKSGLYYITYESGELNEKTGKAERFYRDRAFVIYLKNKNKIKTVSEKEKEIDQLAELIYQYRQTAVKKGKDIKSVFERVIRYLVNESGVQRIKDRRLPDVKLTNKTISEYFKEKSSIVRAVDKMSDTAQNSGLYNADGTYNTKRLEKIMLKTREKPNPIG